MAENFTKCPDLVLQPVVVPFGQGEAKVIEGRKAVCDTTPWTEVTTCFSWTHLPLSETLPWSTQVLLTHLAGTEHKSVSMGCARRRGESHGAATKGSRDKFLIFHALRPTALRALDKRAEALHMALLCPGKILWQARGISIPCFSLQEHRSFIPSPAQPCSLRLRG